MKESGHRGKRLRQGWSKELSRGIGQRHRKRTYGAGAVKGTEAQKSGGEEQGDRKWASKGRAWGTDG